jgi:hypothetical protein
MQFKSGGSPRCISDIAHFFNRYPARFNRCPTLLCLRVLHLARFLDIRNSGHFGEATVMDFILHDQRTIFVVPVTEIPECCDG